MTTSRKRVLLAIVLLIGALGTFSVAQAAPFAPWDEARAVERALSEAQKALIFDRSEDARAHVAVAQERFAQLALVLQPDAPDAVRAAQTALTRAASAADGGNAAALALARAETKTALFGGAYQAALAAVATGDAATAKQWLLVREFRTATRFSRPNADATLAVQALAEGRTTPEEARAVVSADLLDTYQARLNEQLALLDAAAEAGFDVRRAEAVGAARGYWRILLFAYAEQRGTPAAEQASAAFDALVAAVERPDAAAFAAARSQVTSVLQGFRAAPLAAEEQARRAGQLLRFLNLVPVEYGRGVKNGQVTLDIEIQEAITFRDGAAAAFDDLRLPLEQRDAAKTQQVAELLTRLEGNLQAAARRQHVAPPDVIAADTEAALALLDELYLPEWQRTHNASDFDVLASVLDQVETAVAQRQYALAESARLEAYAIFDSGPEPRLLAFAPDQVARVDGLFWQGFDGQQGLAQLIAVRASRQEVAAARAQLDAALVEAQRTLGDGSSAPVAVATNAAVIVFREGLEAVLILASIMASMVGAYRIYRRPLIVGALVALAATALTYIVAQGVLLSLNRFGEKLEAVVSLIAIAVLLLITNWFFHNMYWTEWIARFHKQKRRLIGGAAGQFVGLAILGFTSIYREGFETVLFLQALVLDAGSAVVLQGVTFGLLATAVVGTVTFVIQRKLPYKKMLIVTGVMIGVVLLIMVGNTVHVLQVVGWMPVTPIRGLFIPYWAGLWFGIYPTVESFALQAAAAAFVLGSYYLAERMKHRTKQRTNAQPVAER